jgi:RimJ/RimL family protein N-acetyltransferase
MNADPRVMEFFVAPTPPDVSREQAAAMSERLSQNGFGWFVLELRERSGFGGVIALDDIRWEAPFMPRREIGWRLPVDVWGHGYATEAAATLIRYAFEVLDWPEVVAFTSKLNERSERVMQRLNMTHDPNDDFENPRVPDGHPLRPHVLYRINSSPTT